MGRYMPDAWPLPAINAMNRDFFTSGRLLIQRCASCGTLQHPPEEVCFRCQGSEFTSVESQGRGTVYSFIVTHHPVNPLLQDRVPYGVALVQLDDYPQIRILGNVLNLPPSELRIGLPVRAVFEEIADAETGGRILMPQWEAV